MTSGIDSDLLSDLGSRPTNALAVFRLTINGTEYRYAEAWAAASDGLYEGYALTPGEVVHNLSDDSFRLPRDSASLQVIDPDGTLDSTTDTELDGSTPFVPVGAVERCVDMADDGQVVMIANGVDLWLADSEFTNAPFTAVRVTDADVDDVSTITFINGQFVFDNLEGTQFKTSQVTSTLSATDFSDGNDQASAVSKPGRILRAIEHNSLVTFLRRTVARHGGTQGRETRLSIWFADPFAARVLPAPGQ